MANFMENHLSISISWINAKLHGITALEINFLEIKPTIGEHQSVVRNIRQKDVVLARLL